MSHEKTVAKLETRISKLKGMLTEQERLIAVEDAKLVNDLRILGDAQHRRHVMDTNSAENRANATRNRRSGHQARISELLQQIKKVEDEKGKEAA